jgi:hypothetical protein
MSVYSGPNITKSQLIVHLDAENLYSTKGFNSVINTSTWLPGTTGSATNYNQSGDGNSRILDTNPWDYTDVVWDVSNQDAASDADGGWETPTFIINPTKMYRYSVWVRRKTIGDGSFYLGPHSNWSSTVGQFILNRSNSAQNQNPYFISAPWWGNANQWYLVIGHVWPAGSGSGAINVNSGVYDTSGNKVTNCTDFMWDTTNTYSFHRSYLYYSTNISTNQQFYEPRVDICDGTEPTISELLSGVGKTWRDASGNGNDFFIFGSPVYNILDNLAFNGSSQYCRSRNTLNLLPYDYVVVDIFAKTDVTSPGQALFEHSANWNNNLGGFGLYLHNNGSTDFVNAFHTNYNSNGVARNYQETIGNNWTNHVNIFGTVSDPTGRLTYVNGNLSPFTNLNGYSTGTVTAASTRRNDHFYLASRGGVNSWLNGKISSLKIYGIKLLDNEIRQNFNALRGRFGI